MKSLVPLGGDAADGVVGIAPDISVGTRIGRAARGSRARAIPGKRGFHRWLVAEHGEMLRDRGSRHAVGGKPFGATIGIVRQDDVGGARFEKRLVVRERWAWSPSSICSARLKAFGMRPRQDRQRGDPFRSAVGERPGDAAAQSWPTT